MFPQKVPVPNHRAGLRLLRLSTPGSKTTTRGESPSQGNLEERGACQGTQDLPTAASQAHQKHRAPLQGSQSRQAKPHEHHKPHQKQEDLPQGWPAASPCSTHRLQLPHRAKSLETERAPPVSAHDRQGSSWFEALVPGATLDVARCKRQKGEKVPPPTKCKRRRATGTLSDSGQQTQTHKHIQTQQS